MRNLGSFMRNLGIVSYCPDNPIPPDPNLPKGDDKDGEDKTDGEEK